MAKNDKTIDHETIAPASVRDKIDSLVMAGERLTGDESRDLLYLARDYALLYMTREIVAGNLVEKARVRAYNCLQNAVERHEAIHANNEDYTSITVGFELERPSAPKDETLN